MIGQPTFPVTVFYDGSCILCSREIDLYRRKNHEGRLEFVDISAPGFDPAAYGKTREEFMDQLHVRDAEGRFFVGVDAFPAIWRALPDAAYRLLADVATFPGVHLAATLGYLVFSRLRPYLPKRRGGCPEGTCNIGHRR